MNINFDGEQILYTITIAVICICIVSTSLIIRSCQIEETIAYLNAGCEKTYIPGKLDPVWTNCKKSLGEIK